jgi:hypothetical protein
LHHAAQVFGLKSPAKLLGQLLAQPGHEPAAILGALAAQDVGG